MFYHDALVIAQQRQADLREQAEKHRLLKQIKADKPALRERVLLGAGDFLISCGLQLKRQIQAAGRQTIMPTSQITKSASNV